VSLLFSCSCCKIEKGISRIGKPLDDINTAIENAGKLEIYKLEKKR
jgi:biopolymer transport protein ExbB